MTAVEEGSVTGAARRLGNSNSAISLQLANLEAALGVRLIERSSQRFELTAAGDIFHVRALKILDQIAAAGAAVSRTGGVAKMRLKVAIIEDFDGLVLPNWLERVGADFSGLRFNVKSGPSHENHQALVSRAADIIVAAEPTDAADWVEQHPIVRDPFVMIAAQNVKLDQGLDHLAQLPFIRYSRELLMGRQIEAHFRRNGFMPPRFHEFSSNQAVFSMVKASGGWSIVTAAAYVSHLLEMSGQSGKALLQVSPLPLPAFRRTISLYARKGALDDLPTELAQTLRLSFEQTMLHPLAPTHSFLMDDLGFGVIQNN